jgi:hypothetical protein
VVTSFGALTALVAIALGVRILSRRVRERGMGALRGAGVLLALSLALAGLLLALLPGMDHLWLDGLEEVAPAVRLVFLTAGERGAHRDSREALERGTAELARLRALQQGVQWGARQMPGEQQERLRQFLASRAEIVAGDRVVLATLRAHARARQRFWLGLPLLVLGAAGAAWLGVRPWTRRGRPDQNGS